MSVSHSWQSGDSRDLLTRTTNKLLPFFFITFLSCQSTTPISVHFHLSIYFTTRQLSKSVRVVSWLCLPSQSCLFRQVSTEPSVGFSFFPAPESYRSTSRACLCIRPAPEVSNTTCRSSRIHIASYGNRVVYI